MKSTMWLLGIFLSLLAPVLTGCGLSSAVEDNANSQVQSKFLLREEPRGAIGIAEAKNRLEENENVVLLGRIEAGEFEPWDDGKASFLITDATIEGHHHAEGHECAFCKGKKDPLEIMAIVRFVGDDNKVLSVDARELLGVKKSQTVVVRGRGEVDDLGQLTVSADGIYLR